MSTTRASSRARSYFPRDHGAHPEFRTEWWYITGWVDDAAGREYGVQVTFFRNRPGVAEVESERVRAAPTRVRARGARRSAARTSLSRPARRARGIRPRGRGRGSRRALSSATGRSRARRRPLCGENHGARVRLRPCVRAHRNRRSPQGDAGFSRKGAERAQASYYYSEPQLAVTGTVTVAARRPSPSPALRGSITNGRAP